ncbi:hypothetical protein BDY21DRAFT_364004 [Lineolata rhizophorae]|uniref:DUF2423 domain-containing protein n=1 Tax=Lineolata rhizophorae TaxID=578093 RepID=A0A6A6NZA3_9PEZI|nr:hypothetical protein BDY21DRAFT_364004 [Lineolata rhizophorae]
MAKGLRNKTTKANKTKLRARVFTPAEKARLERLSAKQQELAKQPKPGNEAAPAGDAAGTMDLDNELSEAASTTARKEPDEEGALRPKLSVCAVPISLLRRDGDDEEEAMKEGAGAATASKGEGRLDRPQDPFYAAHAVSQEEHFFHVLGLAGNNVGFDYSSGGGAAGLSLDIEG